MKQITQVTLSLGAAAWFIVGCSPREVVLKSQWQPVVNQPVSFEDCPRFTDRTKQVSVAIVNDDRDMYLMVRLDAQEDQLKTLLFGGSVWINTDGKKQKTKGIRYPLAEPQTIRRLRKAVRTVTDPAAIAADKKVLRMVNLLVKGEVEVPHTNPKGVNATVEMTETSMVYRASIPLDVLGIDELFLADATHQIMVGYETEFVRFARLRGIGGRPRSGGKRIDPEALQEPLKVWIPVQLAYRPHP